MFICMKSVLLGIADTCLILARALSLEITKNDNNYNCFLCTLTTI